jgi:hypothetical protein
MCLRSKKFRLEAVEDRKGPAEVPEVTKGGP